MYIIYRKLRQSSNTRWVKRNWSRTKEKSWSENHENVQFSSLCFIRIILMLNQYLNHTILLWISAPCGMLLCSLPLKSRKRLAQITFATYSCLVSDTIVEWNGSTHICVFNTFKQAGWETEWNTAVGTQKMKIK